MTWLYALKRIEWSAACFAAAAFLLPLLGAKAFYAVAGPAGWTVQLAAPFSVLLPDPISPGTVGGYVQWVGFGTLEVLLALWALESATGAVREGGGGTAAALEVGLAALSIPRICELRGFRGGRRGGGPGGGDSE